LAGKISKLKTNNPYFLESDSTTESLLAYNLTDTECTLCDSGELAVLQTALGSGSSSFLCLLWSGSTQIITVTGVKNTTLCAVSYLFAFWSEYNYFV
jgi:hypothetical protein